MKRLCSKKFIQAQRFFDPDAPENETGNLLTYDEYEEDPSEDLPVITPQDVQSRYMEDDLEEYDGEEEGGEDFEDDLEDIEDAEDYPEFDNIPAAIDWATRNLETIKVIYQTKRGRVIKRVVEPHGSFVARTTGNHIVTTFDETVGDIRAFIIPNIRDLDFAGEEFTRKFVFRP